MDYALAEELKNAGFAFNTKRWSLNPDGGYPDLLSELIEACGEGFNALAYWPRGNKDGDWEVQSSGAVHHLWATNPEEAVARLWLALNKK